MNMIDHPKNTLEPYKTQAQLIKVLTHPARLAIIDILRNGEQCVCHMEAHLGLRQAYISQQLAILREAGLIQDRKDGWNVFYSLTDPRVLDLLEIVERLTPGEDCQKHTDQPVTCPCPKCNQ